MAPPVRFRRTLPGLLIALALAGCGPAAAPRAQRVPVRVARAERRAAPLEVDVAGTVEAVRSASVHPQVGGLVTAIRFRPGQEVREGEPLFEIDRRPLEADLARARGALARSRAQERLARVQADRAEQLFAQQLISASEHDQDRANADVARAQVVSDSAAVATAVLSLQFATVRAPISGRTGDRLVHEGDLVKENATDQTLVQIQQLRPILVRFTLPERELPSLAGSSGRDLPLYAKPAGSDGPVERGRLVFVDNAVDPSTGTVLLKGEFPNSDGRLWPGQSVEARLVLDVDPSAVVVPTAAVTPGQGGTLVFVVGPDSTVSARPVKVGHASGDMTVIASGIEPGETVVTDGQFRLAPGSRVVIVPDRPGSAVERAANAAPAGGAAPSTRRAAAMGDPPATAPARRGAR